MPRKVALEPIPRQNVVAADSGDGFRVTGLPARMELRPREAAVPSGWVLLRGRLHRRGLDYNATLFAEGDGFGEVLGVFPLPSTRKGTILELIRLPKGTVRLVLEPMRSQGEFVLNDLSLAETGGAERIARMWRRVLPLFYTQSRDRRRRAGLYAWTPLLDLQKAYRIAGRFRAYAPSLPYAEWIRHYDACDDHDRRRMRRTAKRWGRSPRFSVLIPAAGASREALQRTIASLDRQVYRSFHAVVVAEPHAGESAGPALLPPWVQVRPPGAGPSGDVLPAGGPQDDRDRWHLLLRPGEMLSEQALHWIASEAVGNGRAGLIYADHDRLGEENDRRDPVFKPDWSPELLRSTNYIGPAAAIRADVLAEAGGLPTGDLNDGDLHDLYFRVSERLEDGSIRHIPAVLWHLPAVPAGTRDRPPAGPDGPVAAHLRRLGVAAEVEETAPGFFRVRYALPDAPPLVSIIVPTRDAVEHLRSCIGSVLEKSSYPRYEIIVVDNRSRDPRAAAYLRDLSHRPRVRVLRYDLPFNYAAINNVAVHEAAGDVVCLLNNDTEVITGDWLEEMAGRLLQPNVGVVGAKLYYADGRIQHGGDTVGPGGCAAHLHSLLDRDAAGYCSRAVLAQDLSAVTAACLMTRRELFLRLGGLDERNLAVAFNDVDYCLRVRDAGLRVVWTPYAELYHHESVSRGNDQDREGQKRMRREAAYMRRRWKSVMRHDPFYNPNLSYERADFSLGNAPAVKKPWTK